MPSLQIPERCRVAAGFHDGFISPYSAALRAGCYLGAAALLYLFSAQLLAAIDIWLLPRRLLVEMLRYRAMWLVFFLTLPTVGYLLWRGSDLVAWWRAPAALTLDERALRLGPWRYPMPTSPRCVIATIATICCSR